MAKISGKKLLGKKYSLGKTHQRRRLMLNFKSDSNTKKITHTYDVVNQYEINVDQKVYQLQNSILNNNINQCLRIIREEE